MALIPTGFQPDGFLGGMLARQNKDQIDVENNLSNVLKMLTNSQKGIELGTSMATQDSDIASKNATNLATAATIGREKEANTGILENKRRMSDATFDTERDATNSGNEAKTAEHRLKKAEAFVDTFATQLPAIMAAGPNAQAEFIKLAKEHGINENSALYRTLINAKSPAEFNDLAERFIIAGRDTIATQRARYLKQEEYNSKGAWDERIEKIKGDFAKQVAAIYAAARAGNKSGAHMRMEQLLTAKMDEYYKSTDENVKKALLPQINQLYTDLMRLKQAGVGMTWDVDASGNPALRPNAGFAPGPTTIGGPPVNPKDPLGILK